MSRFAQTKIFNNPAVFVRGWYWAFVSADLKKGQVKGLELLGRQLAVFRGESGQVTAMDAFCPHMGAHFKEGKVIGDSIRCGFHNWKFNAAGECTELPFKNYEDQCSIVPKVPSHPTTEKYGMIWIFAGAEAGESIDPTIHPIPYFTDLGPDAELEYIVGYPTYRPCRPEVVMLNAIDAHHFNAVHPEASILADGMELAAEPMSPQMIRLRNRTGLPKNWVGRLLAPLYKKGVLNYSSDYWSATTGIVSLGPDALQFRLIFPHRPTLHGGTEGHMIFVAPKRKGFAGKIVARLIIWVTYIVGTYFEKGDRAIFESIQFSMQAPVKADHAIIEFIRHTESQAHFPMPWAAPRIISQKPSQTTDRKRGSSSHEASTKNLTDQPTDELMERPTAIQTIIEANA